MVKVQETRTSGRYKKNRERKSEQSGERRKLERESRDICWQFTLDEELRTTTFAANAEEFLHSDNLEKQI